jgi:hypothetical protein
LLRGIPGYGTPNLGHVELSVGAAMPRWSPDVRQRLYQFQLASPLFMKVVADGEKSVTLWKRKSITGSSGGKRKAEYERLVKLLRPKYDFRRPKNPPAATYPGRSLELELQDVVDAAALRPERTAEILAQVNPPFAFFAAVLNLQAGRHRWTFEVLATANTFASVVVQQFKHAFRILRPADRSPLIQPMLATPGHSSYPAGHATQGHMLKLILAELLGFTATSERYGVLDRLANRIAENRVVAGLHYPVDNTEGARLGAELAAYFIDQVSEPDTPLEWLWSVAKAER